MEEIIVQEIIDRLNSVEVFAVIGFVLSMILFAVFMVYLILKGDKDE